MITDEALYKGYFDGDDASLTLLMERYGDRLTFYINAYLHDMYDSEDLMIEAFAYLITKKPLIREGKFKAYLYKTARHLALRLAAENSKQRCFSFEDMGIDPESRILIEEVVCTEERDRTLHFCMDQLKPDYREALYLVYFENMRHAEAAVVMGKSEKQVADLIYRGKKSLRKRLGQEGLTNAQY